MGEFRLKWIIKLIIIHESLDPLFHSWNNHLLTDLSISRKWSVLAVISYWFQLFLSFVCLFFRFSDQTDRRTQTDPGSAEQHFRSERVTETFFSQNESAAFLCFWCRKSDSESAEQTKRLGTYGPKLSEPLLQQKSHIQNFTEVKVCSLSCISRIYSVTFHLCKYFYFAFPP